MTNKDVPENASRQVVKTFYEVLLGMEKSDLNMLKIGDYPKWARKVLNSERCRRKEHNGAVVQPSKKEREKIIASVIPASKTLGNLSGNRDRKPAAREEIDGAYLHEALACEASYSLVYDKDLSVAARHGERSIVGQFTCTNCGSRVWGSGVISTELWLSTSNRYRTLLHSQKCNKCDRYSEPEVDVDNYVRKVIRTFDLWKGLRDAEEPEYHESTAPHDSRRCHGCCKGICGRG